MSTKHLGGLADSEEWSVLKMIYGDISLAFSQGYYSYRSGRKNMYKPGPHSDDWMKGYEEAKRYYN